MTDRKPINYRKLCCLKSKSSMSELTLLFFRKMATREGHIFYSLTTDALLSGNNLELEIVLRYCCHGLNSKQLPAQ